jgi:hypothetical protein
MATEAAFNEATKPAGVDTPIHWDADKQAATTDPNAGPAIGRVLPTETRANYE